MTDRAVIGEVDSTFCDDLSRGLDRIRQRPGAPCDGHVPDTTGDELFHRSRLSLALTPLLTKYQSPIVATTAPRATNSKNAFRTPLM